jgi:hypothetical protein
MKYNEYILSSDWQRIRRERLQKDGFRCVRCARRHELQVHHLTYERLGHERIDDLVTVCVRCHNDIDFADQRSEITEQMALQAAPVTEVEWRARLEAKGADR